MRHTAAAIRESIVDGFCTRASELQKPGTSVESKYSEYLVQTRNGREA